MQSTTQYLDTNWGMGASHYELVHGVDCPYHSQYMDFATFWDTEEPSSRPRSGVCV